MAYRELKEKARNLRKRGYSYNMISDRLNISKSTLHYWLANVPYTPNQEVINRIGAARAKSGQVKSQQKRESIRRATEQARRDIPHVSKRDLFMLGIGLYLGDGSKSSGLGVVNADPKIIKLAMTWFEGICGIRRENFKLAIHLYPDNNKEASLSHWSKITGIPLSQFGKTQVDRRKSKRMAKRGKLQHGTAHLRVRSFGNKDHGVFLERRVHGWMDQVLTKTRD